MPFCSNCGTPFDEGTRFCAECGQPAVAFKQEINSGPLCVGCGQELSGSVVTFKSKQFHSNCFTCTVCRIGIKDEFYEKDGQAYCKEHFRALAVPNKGVCTRCKGIIESPGQGCSDKQGRVYHLGCFTCGKCNFVLSNDFFVGDGILMCLSCSKQSKSSHIGQVCGMCKKVLTEADKAVKEDEQYFHGTTCYSKWIRKKNMF